MNILWFWALAAMLAVYAVLDGYDLGVGALHLFVARGNHERRVCLNAIGPVWNGNEVWLIAAGGMMVAAFPRLYAAAFSGFYLALIVVLWLLVLRGIAIEFRGHIGHSLWFAFWDAVFWIASLLLALLLGVALGNIVHGLPIGPDGYFLGSFTLMLNPYALLTGLLSLGTLTWHGLNFLRTKAEGELLTRTRRWSRAAWWWSLTLALLATLFTFAQHPGLLAHFERHPVWLVFPAAAIFGFAWSWAAGADHDRRAYWGSVAVIAGLLGSAAATVYPNLLPSTVAAGYSLDIYNAASSPHAQLMAFIANAIAVACVVAYSTYIHRAFRGRVVLGEHSY